MRWLPLSLIIILIPSCTYHDGLKEEQIIKLTLAAESAEQYELFLLEGIKETKLKPQSNIYTIRTPFMRWGTTYFLSIIPLESKPYNDDLLKVKQNNKTITYHELWNLPVDGKGISKLEI